MLEPLVRKYMVHVGWPKRPIPLDQRAQRLCRSFELLHGALGQDIVWKTHYKGLTITMNGAPVDPNSCLRMVTRGQNRHETNKSVIEELGSSAFVYGKLADGSEIEFITCSGLTVPVDGLSNFARIFVKPTSAESRTMDMKVRIRDALFIAWDATEAQIVDPF
jgi:hypothetical protein